MRELEYGADGIIRDIPLITQADATFKVTPTLAVGDVKIATDAVALANLSADMGSFTSGSAEPTPGDTLTGATSSQTCTVIGTVLKSGTWGGGDAAGLLFVKGASGAFQAENLDNTTTSTLNVMTIGSDFTVGAVGEGNVPGTCTFAYTATEMQCKGGSFILKDAAGAEWEDTIVHFQTVGHPDSQWPGGGDASRLASATVSAVGSQTQFDLTNGPPDDDALNGAVVVFQDSADPDQVSYRYITDYQQANFRILINAAPSFTVGVGDEVNVYAIPAQVPDILLDTAEIGTAGAGLTDIPWGANFDDGFFQAAIEAGLLLQKTTIGTYTSQTSFTLAAGSADNDAYNNALVVIRDATTLTQKAVGIASDYVGSTKTLSLVSDPAAGAWTFANGDDVFILPISPDIVLARTGVTIATATQQAIRDEILPTRNIAFNFTFTFRTAANAYVTAATGSAVTVSKGGGAFGAGGGTLSEIANGAYRYQATATDMDGDDLVFRFTATGGTPGAPIDTFVHIVTTGGV